MDHRINVNNTKNENRDLRAGRISFDLSLARIVNITTKYRDPEPKRKDEKAGDSKPIFSIPWNLIVC